MADPTPDGKHPAQPTLRILVDADACPVKEEVYKVALRYGVPVAVVSNSYLRTPDHPLIERVVVGDAFDAADDHIAERTDARTVVVTADILLADVDKLLAALSEGDEGTTPLFGGPWLTLCRYVSPVLVLIVVVHAFWKIFFG